MNINLLASSVGDWSGDGLAIALFQKDRTDGESTETSSVLSTALLELDANKLAGTLQELVSEAAFKAEAGSTIGGRVGANATIRKVLLMGLGEPAKATEDTWRKAAAQAAKWATQSKCQSLAISVPLYNQDEALTAQALAEGILLAAHQDKRFKSKSEDKAEGKEPKPETKLEQVDLLGFSLPAAQTGLETAQKICSGAIAARELVSAPANVVTPITLAEIASAIAAEYKDCMSVKILEKEECDALGMGAFLGVSQASDLPPKFIHLTYSSPTKSATEGNGSPKRKLAIIGKGITFDSGGLNIKAGVGSSIEMMKTDMGGAAATLGAAQAIAQLRPHDIEVHFIIAACENMISGKAIHPGDILTASNGKTIEVNNTDAEGRLTLADALVYADKLGVDAIVDLATLTGACVVALGDSIAGLWSNSDELAAQIESASQKAGEKFWRMPLEEPYFEQMKSVVADFKNTGSRAGGSITAALFLKKFVDKTPAWAHLDIAGPVWTEKENGYINAGGTGYPVRTLVNLVMSMAG
ncbi:leucyl aminopeptidase [Pseudanabaena sp. PCC 6802]|uniref:leucyl aminopeptidase n=1 Tax=Pseudanabaena sp. PCC 6802 TaxID=118173 RepID=UPI00035ECCB9|nr:leucyl aminopeptidase [Pseudanabaena sp. PCC 6802]